MQYEGVIDRWNDDRGFGFINSIDGSEDVFIHIKVFKNISRRPRAGDRVTYTLGKDKNGRPLATFAELPAAFQLNTSSAVRSRKSSTKSNKEGAKIKRSNKPNEKRGGVFSWILCLAAVFAIVILYLEEIASQQAMIIAIAVNVFTYLGYVVDKQAARQGYWRTKESTLHLMALLGGWPAAIAAQNMLRHKTKKAEFRNVFWFTVLLNIAAVSMLAYEGMLYLNWKDISA